MKIKKEKTVFVFQITDAFLKIIKCRRTNLGPELGGLEIEALPGNIGEQSLFERIKEVLKKLRFDNDEIIISLPRHQATCRYLKIPSTNPAEIDKISHLQAWRHLPYPVSELVTGYQIIHTDKEGYSDINLIIAHKDIVNRYINIFKALKLKKFSVVLSPYGIGNLYTSGKPHESGPALVVDIDSNQAEAAVISQKKLLYSRSLRIPPAAIDWESRAIDEITKTCNAYLKEVSAEPLSKIIILTSGRDLKSLAEILNKKISLPVEELSYMDAIKFQGQSKVGILSSNSSLAGLIGLGIQDLPESLNLVPEEVKETTANNFLNKRRRQLILLTAGIALTSLLSVNKSIDNKEKYLSRIKGELNKISKDAKPLEEIEQRLNLMSARGRPGSMSLDILYELNIILPAQVYLTNFTSEPDKQIILRGESPELNPIFEFVSTLQKSPVFKNFEVKVKYATQKKAKSIEAVDFEILCLKK